MGWNSSNQFLNPFPNTSMSCDYPRAPTLVQLATYHSGTIRKRLKNRVLET